MKAISTKAAPASLRVSVSTSSFFERREADAHGVHRRRWWVDVPTSCPYRPSHGSDAWSGASAGGASAKPRFKISSHPGKRRWGELGYALF